MEKGPKISMTIDCETLEIEDVKLDDKDYHEATEEELKTLNNITKELNIKLWESNPTCIWHGGHIY